MDELELLKKDWKKGNSHYPKLSYEEIYGLLRKKSSSIVKWIFIICVIEFMFWGLLNLFIPESYLEIYEKFNLRTFLTVTQVLHYMVLLTFIYFFFKNFKGISVIESTNLLMKKIIRTRKTVNYYVYYNIILYVLISVIVNIIMFSNPETLLAAMKLESIEMDPDKMVRILFIAQVVSLVIVIGLLFGYYRIIYGILLKRLTKNYKELAMLEN